MFRQWYIVLITLLTFVLAWGAEDLIIMNLDSNQAVINVTLIIYCVGGGLVIILSLIAFLKWPYNSSRYQIRLSFLRLSPAGIDDALIEVACRNSFHRRPSLPLNRGHTRESLYPRSTGPN